MVWWAVVTFAMAGLVNRSATLPTLHQLLSVPCSLFPVPFGIVESRVMVWLD
ncbi:hypothetical protein [Moorena sp. SIO3H5]|uniref:hypothetical protein n=1 Tax=Moorena sp. SIO3H5 TaxID=2607834 RepID=UPI0013B8BA50|nr:hypothetical protein [Moorena sp. SIO3H5]NEO71219.1 hypothetical protein [Moorena sp. SIO3H5]